MAEDSLRGSDLMAMLLAGYKPKPTPQPIYPIPPEGPYDCQSCGACCVEAGPVPVYPSEDQVPTERLSPWTPRREPGHPPGMRQMTKHIGGRCMALEGTIGGCVSCTIYTNRPKVCATFTAGSEGCKDARLRASQKMLSSTPFRGYGPDWQESVN